MFKLNLFALLLVLASQTYAKQTEIQVFTEESPPYQYLSEGKLTGSIADKVRAMFNEAKLNASYNVFPWARAYDLTLKTKNSFIFAMAKTSERKNKFIWIAPLYEFKPHLVGLKSRSELKIDNLEQAKQFTIAIQRGDFAHTYLLQKGFVEGKNLIIAPSIKNSWWLLSKGKVDFIIDDNVLNLTDPHSKLTTSVYETYFELKDLREITYLAANKDTDPKLIERLRAVSGKR